MSEEIMVKGSPMLDATGALWNRPSQRSTQPVIPTDEGYEYCKLVKVVMGDTDELLTDSAFRGDATQNFRLAARNVHLQTRAFYHTMMVNIGNNIYPMMLLSDSDDCVPGGVGGMVTVYHGDLSIERHVPTPPSYELLKNLSHMSLGVFCCVEPWLRCKNGLEPDNAQDLLHKVKLAHKAANNPDVNFGADELHILETAKIMYGIVEKFLEKWIAAGNCSVADYETFARVMNKYVPNNIKEAAAIQANHLYPVLKKIKAKMGKEWEKLYVVVPTVWPVSGLNPRVEILSRLMTPDQMNTRVFIMDNLATMDMYRLTLGRIVGDRCSANLIFGTCDTQDEKDKMLYALSTRQDLMANACDEAMKVIHKKEKALEKELVGGVDTELTFEDRRHVGRK